MKYVFILLFVVSFCYGYERNIKICYNTDYFFLTVAKTCIEYRIDNDKIRTYVISKSVGIARLFKNVRYEGYAVADRKSLKPIRFYFLQKEKNLKIVHNYVFSEDHVEFSKIVEKDGKLKKRISKKIKINDCCDPFTASLKLLESIKMKDKGKLKVFFNGKVYNIPFKVTSVSKLFKVEIKPEYDIEGYLKPSGRWIAWINPRENTIDKIMVRIRVGKIWLNKE
ncbi:DUF3108 domain-containing protein [Persephonella sp.]